MKDFEDRWSDKPVGMTKTLGQMKKILKKLLYIVQVQ